MSEEIILLGDQVVYRDDIKGFDNLGLVAHTNGSSLRVLWNDEDHPRTEQYDRLRLARLDEIESQCREIKKY